MIVSNIGANMPKTTAERQAEHRARLIARAELFEAANTSRKNAILRQIDEMRAPCCPEEKYVRQYFINNPNCSALPAMSMESGALHASFGEYAEDVRNIAAFAVAVRSISSIAFRADFQHGDGASGQVSKLADLPEDVISSVVTAENKLRVAGLWSGQ